jgi:hypothetical protein
MLSLWCIGCANIMAPTGGPSDTVPPKLVARTVQDSTVGFKGGKIKFIFDEQVDVVKLKINSTPFLKGTPKISSSKNGFEIEIADTSLEPNTTYRIDLGKTVCDINEGVAIPGFNFCFSTGQYLDTLSVRGTVVDAATALPDTSAYICLYASIANDSDITIKKPMYACKVDAQGKFALQNLPSKEFYLYSIGDKNGNFMLDMSTERIGFLPTSILPSAGNKSVLSIRTISQLPDTIGRNKGANRKGVQRFTINIDTTNPTKRSFDITKNIEISFANQLSHYDLSKIRLFGADGVLDETGLASYDSMRNTISITVDLQKDTLYELRLLDSFARDTATFTARNFLFRTKKDADYGSLTVELDSAEDLKNKIIVLYQNDSRISKQLVRVRNNKFTMLSPGNYQVVLIDDTNGNGEWDNGRYFGGKQQAELVRRRPSDIIVKANWDNVVKWESE